MRLIKIGGSLVLKCRKCGYIKPAKKVLIVHQGKGQNPRLEITFEDDASKGNPKAPGNQEIKQSKNPLSVSGKIAKIVNAHSKLGEKTAKLVELGLEIGEIARLLYGNPNKRNRVRALLSKMRHKSEMATATHNRNPSRATQAKGQLPIEAWNDVFEYFNLPRPEETEKVQDLFMRVSTPFIIPEDYMERQEERLAKAALVEGYGICMWGHTEAGKTILAEKVFKDLGYERYIRVQGSTELAEDTDVLVDVERFPKPGEPIKYSPKKLLLALLYGWPILIDEINCVKNPQLWTLLHSVLDDTCMIQVTKICKTGVMVPVKPVIIATANPHTENPEATVPIDVALRSRMFEITVPNLPEDVIVKIIANRTKMSETDVASCFTLMKKYKLFQKRIRAVERACRIAKAVGSHPSEVLMEEIKVYESED